MRSPQLALAFILGLYASIVFAQTTAQDSLNSDDIPAITQEQTTSEQVGPAPVIFKKDTLFLISHSPGEYPATYRANQIMLFIVSSNINIILLVMIHMHPDENIIG